jgi:hypothetical protein
LHRPDCAEGFDAIYVAVMSRYSATRFAAMCRVWHQFTTTCTLAQNDYFAEVRTPPNAIFINDQHAQQGTAHPRHRRAEALINQVLARRRHVNLLPHEVRPSIVRVGLCLSRRKA